MEGHTAHVAAVLLALEVTLPRLFLLTLHRLLLLPRLLLLLRLLLEFELALQDLIAQQLQAPLQKETAILSPSLP